MEKTLSDEDIARCEGDGLLFPVGARRMRLLALVACLIVAGCGGVGYQPPPGDHSGPVHSEPGGGGGGSGGM
jgi:hypothetical protein